MDLKQSTINLGWKLDTSELERAKMLTDKLVNSISSNGVDASKKFSSSFGSVSDSIDKTKDKFRSLLDAQKQLTDLGMDKSVSSMDRFSASIDKSISQVARLKDRLGSLSSSREVSPVSSVARTTEKTETKPHSLGSTVIGGAVGGLVGGAIGSVTSYVSSMAKSAFQADQAAQQVQLAWTTMGVKSKDAVASLTSQIGELTKQANISGADTTAVQKNFYNATNGNIAQTKELTNEMFAFGKSTGMSSGQIVQATGSMGRLFSASKVSVGSFSRITKQMPAMKSAIISASGESAAKFTADMQSGKISGSQLRDLMVKAAQDSGNAWTKYGQTAGGAIAKLQGTQTQLWKDTMKGMAGDANQGLIQLSNLFAKNEKPIADMMTGIGKGLTNVASGAINFLVKNQKPLGSIAQSLVSIVGTVGNAVWGTFSTIVQAIGKSFGLVSGNTKASNSPLQTFANILKDIASHKEAIQVVATTLAGMFVAKKALAFASSLKEVAGAIGLVNAAEAGGEGGGKSSFLQRLVASNTSIGKFSRGKQESSIVDDVSGDLSGTTALKLGKSARTVTKNVKGANLLSNGLFRTKSTLSSDAVKLSGEGFSAAPEIAKTGRFASIASRLGGFGSRFAESGLVRGAGALASRIPLLDVAAAGTQLIGINNKNAGGKIGSAGGMLGGTIAGAAGGAALGSAVPVIGTAVGGLVGGAVGGIGGSAVGKKLGQTIQNVIPKSAISSINKAFGSVKSTVSSTMNSIGKSFKPVTKGFSDFVNAAKKSEAVKDVVKSIQTYFKVWGSTVGAIFQGVSSVIKGVVRGIGTYLSTTFTGIFKVVGGIFKTGADLLTGRWSKLGSDLKSIGSGILDVLVAPFKAAWSTISSIGSDIISSVKGIWSSIASMGSKVANIAKNPVKAIESMFATGTKGKYANGLPNTTNAVVNDGRGPELIDFGGRYGMYKGRNVHTTLPKGSHVYSAEDTQKIVGVQHFAQGTTRLGASSSVVKMNVDSKQPVSSLQALSRSMKTNSTKMHSDLLKINDSGNKKVNDSNTSFANKTLANFTNLGKQLNPIWEKTISAFGNYFSGLGPNAKTGMQGAVDALNQGISGIDKTLSQFGGNDSVLNPIHYADGTKGEVTQDHLAVVNDAKSGPQMEAIVNPQGGVRYAKGSDATTVIRKGESVLNGNDTQEAIREGLIPHYAKGKSSKKALRSLAKANAKNPTGAFAQEFSKNISLTGSGLQKGLTKAGANAAASATQGYKWSGAMWNVISNAISGGGAATGLLAAVENYGKGHSYVWGATGPDSFDCSGLVQYALKHAFGISYPRTSGEQIAKASSISRSDAEAGDLVGNDEHIGVVADKGGHHYFSAFNPSSHPNILMTPLDSTYFPGTMHFGRVSGTASKQKASNSSGIKGVSPFMKKLVTAELGSSALNNVTKQLSTSDAGGAAGNPAGDGVQRWKPLVKKALSALGLSGSADMVNRVLRQINTESSGNPNAIGGTDGLADGRAMGLMQVKPGTFAAYGKPSLGKWNNGYASIYAGLNYAKHRYGDSLSFLGNGHGYAAGGKPTVGETAWVGEQGPELLHFDSPSTIKNHAKSVSDLRSQTTNQTSSGARIDFQKGAISVTVQGAKDASKTATEVGNIIERKLRKLFRESKIDLQGGMT